MDEGFYLCCIGKDAEPLLFLECDRKAAHSIEGKRPLLTHLQSETALVFALELSILRPQAKKTASKKAKAPAPIKAVQKTAAKKMTTKKEVAA